MAEENTIDISGMLAPKFPYGAGYDTNRTGIPNIVVTAQKGGGGRGLSGSMRGWDVPAGGFEWRDLGGVGDPITLSKGLDVHWTDMPDKFDKKTEQPQTTEQQKQSFFTKLLGRLQNIKDPEKRQAWFKRLMGNILRLNPATGPAMGVYDLVKMIKEGGQEGVMGALGQMGMQKVFGPNLDVAQGIFGAASGRMTPGHAFGGVAMNRGMRAGIQGLMKNIYKQYGMRGVQIAMPLVKTALQGPGKG
jgi:hypothetical protein